jgi:hypothetical protein
MSGRVVIVTERFMRLGLTDMHIVDDCDKGYDATVLPS